MIQELVQQFMGSPQGQTALGRLQQQGFAPQQAQAFMGAALPTAAQAFHQAQSGGLAESRPGGPQGILDVGNSHYVTNFLSGAVSGLLRGEGISGAAVDGLQGVVGGHVGQVIASRFGLPQRVAGTVGAILTPLMIDFLWSRVNGGGLDLGSLFGGGGQPAPTPMGSGGWGGAPAPSGGGGWGGGAPAPTGGWGAGSQGVGTQGSVQGSPQGGPAPVGATVQGGLRGGLGSLFGQLFKS
jgi:hypothetical protein